MKRVETDDNPLMAGQREAKPENVTVAVNALRRRMMGLAMKLIWNKADAEELTQEALSIAVAKQIDLASDHAAAWCLRTVAHLCLNRRRLRQPEMLDDWVGADTSPTPAARFDTAERLDRLRNCVAKLPPQQRLGITLRWMDEMPYSDVAAVMEISESAVRAHVHQARKALAAMMKED